MLQAIAFIPDGNRRYAEKYNLDLLSAYHLGFNKAERVFDWCLKLPDLKTSTIYALSTENLNRKNYELKVLQKLFDKYFRDLSKHPKIHDNEVKVKIIGKKEDLPDLKESISLLENNTKDYKKFELNIALGYGGRDELIKAFKEVEKSGEPITEENIQKHLYMNKDIDLLIRTGSNQRLSNFLTWQTTYSELYFTPKLWGEYDKKEFNKSIEFYEATQRNFGK